MSSDSGELRSDDINVISESVSLSNELGVAARTHYAYLFGSNRIVMANDSHCE